MHHTKIRRLTSVLLLCIVCIVSSDLSANNTIDSLKNLILEEEVDTLKFDLYSKLIKEISYIDRQAAIRPSKEQLDLAVSLGDSVKVADCAHNLGSQYLYFGDTDSSYIYTIRAFKILKDGQDLGLLTDALNNLALLYQRSNRYEEAVEAYQDVIIYSDSLQDYIGEVYASVNLMSLFMDLKDEQRALEYYQSIIEIIDKVPEAEVDVVDELKGLYSVIYMNAGLCHVELNQLDSAIFYFEKAETALSNIENSYALSYWEGYVKGNLGGTYFKLAQEGNITSLQEKNEYLFKSLDLSQGAYALFDTIQEDRGKAFTLVNIGKSYNGIGQYEKARTSLQEAIELSQSIDFIESLRDAYEQMAKNAEYRKDYKSSNEYLQKWFAVHDTISNENRIKFTRGLEVKFETAKKEKEISELALENEIQTKEQTIQRYIFFTSLLLLLGAVYMVFSRFRFQKQREKAEFEKRVNKAMSRFVPMDFIKAIGREKIIDVELGDQIEKEVTVVFTDIRSFTTISEGMTPQENFAFVKEYAERMGPIIEKNNGFVSQYLGDGIMAIFQNTPDDALKACVEMQRDIEEYNLVLKEKGQDPIKVGMGMHTGPLIMGIIGDEERRDATLISDAVNSAARIESTTKALNVDILLSENSVMGLSNRSDFQLDPMGEVSVKGKQNTIKVYKCAHNINTIQHDKEVQFVENN